MVTGNDLDVWHCFLYGFKEVGNVAPFFDFDSGDCVFHVPEEDNFRGFDFFDEPQHLV